MTRAPRRQDWSRELLRLLPPESAVKAIRAAEEGRVIRISSTEGFGAWVVEGERGAYLVLGDYFCTCTDFYIEALLRRGRPYCYHLIAKEIAEAEGKVRERVVGRGELTRLLMELTDFRDDP